MTRYQFIKSNCDVKALHEIGVTKSSLITEMRVMSIFLITSGKKMERYSETSVKSGLGESRVREIISYMNQSI